MKRIIAIIIILLSSNFIFPQKIEIDALASISFPAQWEDEIIDAMKEGKSLKKNIAVLDFEGSENFSNIGSIEMAEILITQLKKSGGFEIIERNKLKEVIQEQNLQLSGIVNEETAVEMGNLLGAEYLVMGKISSVTETKKDKFAYTLVQLEVGIDVRVINTSTGNIIFGETASGITEEKIVMTSSGQIVSGAINYNSAYEKAARIAAEKIATRLSDLSIISGFVIQNESAETVLDIGNADGVKNGMYFLVFRLGNELTHPVTKKHLGWQKELVDVLKINKVEKKMCKGIRLVEDNDKLIQPSDLVVRINEIPED